MNPADVRHQNTVDSEVQQKSHVCFVFFSCSVNLLSESMTLSSSDDLALPEWLSVGESVQVKPGYSPGVVAFVGNTQFSPGTWVGVELDAPTGQ